MAATGTPGPPPTQKAQILLSLVGRSAKFSDLVILMDSGPFLGFDFQVGVNQVGCKKNKKILRSKVHIFSNLSSTSLLR